MYEDGLIELIIQKSYIPKNSAHQREDDLQ
jgi:hypothetical protein